MHVSASIRGSAHTLRDSTVQAVRHVGTEELLSKLVVNTSLSRMPRYRQMIARYKTRERSNSGTTVWVTLSTVDLRTILL